MTTFGFEDKGEIKTLSSQTDIELFQISKIKYARILIYIM